jgi:hypothetical protein
VKPIRIGCSSWNYRHWRDGVFYPPRLPPQHPAQPDGRDTVSSGAPFQLVTSFSEWGEGTAIESAKEWATPSGFGAYLDAPHVDGAR